MGFYTDYESCDRMKLFYDLRDEWRVFQEDTGDKRMKSPFLSEEHNSYNNMPIFEGENNKD